MENSNEKTFTNDFFEILIPFFYVFDVFLNFNFNVITPMSLLF